MLAVVDDLLRAEGRHGVDRPRVAWAEILFLVAAGGFLYGSIMGSYGGRSLQSLYSAIKVPLLLGVSAAICLPSFYVINSLLGLREDFAAACRGVLASQATLAISLAALGPVTLFAYLSDADYRFAVVLNGMAFALSSVAAQMSLMRHYAPLIARNPRHRAGRVAWLSLYIFVAIQMAWVLRPFVGAPGLGTRFFREDAWSNAYVRVLRLVWRLLAAGD